VIVVAVRRYLRFRHFDFSHAPTLLAPRNRTVPRSGTSGAGQSNIDAPSWMPGNVRAKFGSGVFPWPRGAR
jgi:hypothetical protein